MEWDDDNEIAKDDCEVTISGNEYYLVYDLADDVSDNMGDSNATDIKLVVEITDGTESEHNYYQYLDCVATVSNLNVAVVSVTGVTDSVYGEKLSTPTVSVDGQETTSNLVFEYFDSNGDFLGEKKCRRMLVPIRLRCPILIMKSLVDQRL